MNANSPPANLSRFRILLIEDDHDLREILHDFLETEGFSVSFAVDGQEALEKLNALEQCPDLIILDWMMPRMGGRQFCVAKKAYPRIDTIPIILLTAAGEVGDKVKQAGATTGIAKPVNVDLLLSAIYKIASPRETGAASVDSQY